LSRIVITGPSASGKNAVAQELATRLPRVAIVDVETVRRFAVQPHKLPSAVEADWNTPGDLDWRLAVRIAAMSGNALSKDGFTVLILDVVTTESAALYRGLLGPRAKVVQLLPSYTETLRRFQLRGPEAGGLQLSEAEFDRLYRQQESLTAQDHRLDNSDLSAAEAAAAMEAWL
jgi:hypothetical protein